MQFVTAGEDRLLLLRPQGVLDRGVVLVCTENQSQGRIIPFGPTFPVVIIYVQLQLSQVLMRELARLQVNHYVAFENGVIEDQINVEMIAIQGKPLLTGDKSESSAQFEQKGLQVIDQCLFKIGLDEFGRLGKT